MPPKPMKIGTQRLSTLRIKTPQCGTQQALKSQIAIFHFSLPTWNQKRNLQKVFFFGIQPGPSVSLNLHAIFLFSFLHLYAGSNFIRCDPSYFL